MGRIKIIIMGCILLNVSYAGESKAVKPPKKWVRRVIHEPDNPPPYNYSPGEITIGDARNDGVNRLYCANLNGDLVEYSWENNEWVKRTCLSGTDFTGIVIGKARATDNLNRIYCYKAKGNWGLYEITYENGIWTMQEIPLPRHPISSVIIGDGRNDGINRLYIGTPFFKSYEFKYNGDEWILESMVSDHIEIGSLGNGRGDGINRLYGVTKIDSLFEITYVNGSWEEELVGIWPNPENLAPGGFALPDLFHFGLPGPMIIVKAYYDRIFYAFKYDHETQTWNVTQMHPYYPRYLYGLSPGYFNPFDVMQDPRSYLFKKNLYVAAVPEDVEHGDTLYIHEFVYNPAQNTWTRNVISYISILHPTPACIVCGNIRGKDCIYGISWDGTIVEISYE